MTAEEVKQSITTWCSTDDDLEFTGDRSEPSTDFAIGIRAGGSGGAPVDLQVLQGQGADRLTIRHTASASGSSAQAAQTLLDERPGWVTGSVDRADTGTSVNVQTFVYLDGFSQHTFTQAVAEIARTARLLGGLSTSAAASPAASPVPTPAATPSYQPQPAATPAPQPQPMPAPSFAPQPQPQQQYQPQPQPQSYQPQPQAPQVPGGGPWVPTHSVPPQGLRAWAAPDPSGPVVANLAPGLPIQVSEVRGAWARIICSNGWTGWIDGRLIGVAA